MALQNDGGIIVAGSSYNSSTGYGFVVMRYLASGSTDPIFGTATTPFGSGNDRAFGVAIQADGKIIVSGEANIVSGEANKGVAVVRYRGGSSLTASDLGDTDFDGLVHLAEYALNLSPTTPNPPPPAEHHAYADGERLRMFFTRDPARNDVTIEVQAADSAAGPWASVATSTLGSVTTGPGYIGGDDAAPGLKTVEVRDIVNLTDAAQRFLRVRVTH
jgi:hypothetical protein